MCYVYVITCVLLHCTSLHVITSFYIHITTYNFCHTVSLHLIKEHSLHHIICLHYIYYINLITIQSIHHITLLHSLHHIITWRFSYEFSSIAILTLCCSCMSIFSSNKWYKMCDADMLNCFFYGGWIARFIRIQTLLSLVIHDPYHIPRIIYSTWCIYLYVSYLNVTSLH